MQIGCLCLELTDDGIKRALRDLPKDLSTTFHRILERSSLNKANHAYQRQILSYLLSAFRPFKTTELREALAVVPGDTAWKAERCVNNIYQTLACCGSLVTVAEEELTVHFIHQSVVQFLLDDTCPLPGWHFTIAEAGLHLGEVCVTYLSYGTFDQRVSTYVVPKIPVGLAPNTIAENTLKDAGLIGKLALRLLQLKSQGDPDIGRAIAEAGRFSRKRHESSEPLGFFDYASEYWMLHTTAIQESSTTFNLWRGLLRESRFDGLVWGPNEVHPSTMVVDEESGNIWALPPRITWAISHSHLPLLSVELRGSNGLRGLCSALIYIRLLLRTGNRLKANERMRIKLLRIAVAFESDEIANALIRSGKTEGVPRHAFLQPFLSRGDLASVRKIIALRDFGSLDTLDVPIIELACRAHDVHTVEVAISCGANVNFFEEQHPLAVLLDTMEGSHLELRLVAFLLRAKCTLRVCEGIPYQLYWYLRHCLLAGTTAEFDPFPIFMQSGLGQDALSSGTRKALVQRACENGDSKMVMTLLYGWETSTMSFDPTYHVYPGLDVSSDVFVSWLMSALHSLSIGRIRIVNRLVEDFGSEHCINMQVLARCVQLRAWSLAEKALQAFVGPEGGQFRSVWELSTISESVQRTHLLHLCASCGDSEGLEFLLEEHAFDLGVHMQQAWALSVPAPIHLDAQGHKPLQIVLTQTLTCLGTADRLEREGYLSSAATIMEAIDVHTHATCGTAPYSCVELGPRFFASIVQNRSPARVNVLTGETSPDFPYLARFLRSWLAHYCHTSRLHLALPIMEVIIRTFKTLVTQLERNAGSLEGEHELDLLIKLHSGDYTDFALIIMQAIDTRDLNDLFYLLLLNAPDLKDDVERFEELFTVEYGVRSSLGYVDTY